MTDSPVPASDVEPVPAPKSHQWESRIIGSGLEDPEQLLANPRNWRIHPKRQQEATAKALDTVGWVTGVIVNARTGHVIDGHMRVALALSRGSAHVPVQYVDLDEEQERIVLATLDPLGDLAATDDGALKGLLGDLDGKLDAELAAVMADITKAQGSAAPALPDDDDMEAAQDKLDRQFEGGQQMIEVTCPHCGGDFAVNPGELKA